jgi:hypothetical protein
MVDIQVLIMDQTVITIMNTIITDMIRTANANTATDVTNRTIQAGIMAGTTDLIIATNIITMAIMENPKSTISTKITIIINNNTVIITAIIMVITTDQTIITMVTIIMANTILMVTTNTETVNIRTDATSHMTKPDTMAAIMDHTTAQTVDIITTDQTIIITMAIIIMANMILMGTTNMENACTKMVVISHMTKPDTMAGIMDHTTAQTVDIITTDQTIIIITVIMMVIKMIIITEIIIIMDQTTTITMAIIIIMLGAGTQKRASAMETTVPTAVKKMIVTTTVWAVIWATSGCTNAFATCNANGHQFLGDTCVMKKKRKMATRSKYAIQIESPAT